MNISLCSFKNVFLSDVSALFIDLTAQSRRVSFYNARLTLPYAPLPKTRPIL